MARGRKSEPSQFSHYPLPTCQLYVPNPPFKALVLRWSELVQSLPMTSVKDEEDINATTPNSPWSG